MRRIMLCRGNLNDNQIKESLKAVIVKIGTGYNSANGGFSKNSYCTFQFSTSTEVEDVKIIQTGVDIETDGLTIATKKYTDSGDVRTWTVKFKTLNVTEKQKTYSLITYNVQGNYYRIEFGIGNDG